VNVVSHQLVEKVGKSIVHECVPVTKEGVCNVVSYTQVEKQGKSIVYECVPETVHVKQTYCEYVPYTTVIKVPVCIPCCH
jgi:hypothetical protein